MDFDNFREMDSILVTLNNDKKFIVHEFKASFDFSTYDFLE